MIKNSTWTSTSSLTLIINMKPSEILYQLRDLRDSWRRQSFTYTNDQQKRFDELKKLRHDRINEMYENGKVYKSGASK